MRDHVNIADSLAAKIASGEWPAGMRLPPQRRFAFEQGIAASTAGRVYAELARRGLVSGEVGRGTFVRPGEAHKVNAISEAAGAPIDLQLSMSLLPQQLDLMEKSRAAFFANLPLAASFSAHGPRGPAGAQSIAARFLAAGAWRPEPSAMLFSGSGRQAILAALGALCRPGDRVGVEALTYPVVKGAAARLGLRLLPIEMDAEGIIPGALQRVHAAQPLACLYLQPTLHNPLGATMGAVRRAAIATVLRETGLIAVEDGVYGFLQGQAPLQADAPDNIIYIDSLSKRFASGSGLGFLVPPKELAGRVVASLRSGGWTAASFAATQAMHWVEDGTVARVQELKRADAVRRQVLTREILRGQRLVGDPSAYYVWLELPEPWRGDSFVAAAFQRGVALTPGSAFAVTPGHMPNAVRVAVSAPPIDKLREGLEIIGALLADGPDDVIVE